MFLSGFNADDVYIGYLPLAHVLELLSECTMMMFGVPVGYSSPNTMTDMSTKVVLNDFVCNKQNKFIHLLTFLILPLYYGFPFSEKYFFPTLSSVLNTFLTF